ncbi:uncharacterized protein TNCV_1406361 [Trichonephila clavipes]|nr:uncharacterized protein TNCV_1406361 [Trichonephila clavipes]
MATHFSYIYITKEAIDTSIASSDIEPRCKWDILEILGSDHLPFLNEIKMRQMPTSNNKQWIFKKADWQSFAEIVDNEIKSIPLTDSVDLKRCSFKEMILRAANKCIPRGIESVIKRKCEVGTFVDDIVLWKSDSDLTKLERDVNLVLEDIRNFVLDHKLSFNHTNYVCLRYKSSETRKGSAHCCSDHHWPKNTCSRDIVLFEADLQPLSLRRRACVTKLYSKHISLDSRNRTSANFNDWCNSQILRRNSPFSQMSSFNPTIGVVEPHHLSQCLDPADDLDQST